MREALQTPEQYKLVEKILDRQKRLEEKRAPFDALYDDVDDYIIGRRANYDTGDKRGAAAGEKAGSKIYDQTAAMAIQDFVDGYQGNTAAPTIDWWSPQFRSEEVMRLAEAKKWLDLVRKAITIEINNSNFYGILSEATWDRALNGYSTVYGPEWSARRNRLIYYLRPPREVYFSLNAEGDPDLWHRKFLISGRQILDLWPDAPLKENFIKKIEKNPYKEYTCIHAIFPREERDISHELLSINKPVASVYILEEGKVVLEESGIQPDEGPTVARWRISGEAYPRSVAIDTIYQVMMLNKMSLSVLKSAQLLVEPPMIITGTTKGKVKIVPNAQIILEGPNDKVEPLQFPSSLQAGIATVGDVRAACRDSFKAKIFSMMSQITSQVTATQIEAMKGEQATLLLPVVTRDQNENLIPLIKKTFKVLARAGRIPAPPPSLAPFINTPVDIMFSGPITMMARRNLRMQWVNVSLPQVLALAKEAPQLASMLDKLDPDAVYDDIMEAGGAPAKVTRDEKIVAQIRDTRAKAMQQQQKQEAMNKTADTLHKGSTAPEPGSPSEKVMSGGQG